MYTHVNMMMMIGVMMKMNMSDVEPNYLPKWQCYYCGSYNIETIEHARVAPNHGYAFVESWEIRVMHWGKEGDGETSCEEGVKK